MTTFGASLFLSLLEKNIGATSLRKLPLCYTNLWSFLVQTFVQNDVNNQANDDESHRASQDNIVVSVSCEETSDQNDSSYDNQYKA
jgi:hypothetical protein